MEIKYSDDMVIEINLEIGEVVTLAKLDSAAENTEGILYGDGVHSDIALENKFYCFGIDTEEYNEDQLNIEFEIVGDIKEDEFDTEIKIIDIDII